MRTMFDVQVKRSRIRLEAARRAGLKVERCKTKYVETLYRGMEEVNMIFHVPLKDRQGREVMVRALGTNYIAYSHEYKLPKDIT